MAQSTVIVGVDPEREDQQRDAIALGAVLASLKDAGLLLVTVFAPERTTTWNRDLEAHEEALHAAIRGSAGELDGMSTEILAAPGGSIAGVLHALADRRAAAAIVVGSSEQAAAGTVEPGDAATGLLHGGGCPVAIAPRGFAERHAPLSTIGAAFVDTPEGRDAVRHAGGLADAAGAAVRVVTVFDPLDYVEVMRDAESDAELRTHARGALDDALDAMPVHVSATGALRDGDPVTTLADVSGEVDLLVVGSRSYGPLRAVLLGRVTGELVRRARCPLLVVPHGPTPEHEVTLAGGLDAFDQIPFGD